MILSASLENGLRKLYKVWCGIRNQISFSILKIYNTCNKSVESLA